MTAVVDSPLPTATDLANGLAASPAPQLDSDLHDGAPLYFVVWKAIAAGRWHVWTRDNGDQAIATTLERAEAYLTEAKQAIAKLSNFKTLAAVGLRIATSPTDEL